MYTNVLAIELNIKKAKIIRSDCKINYKPKVTM